MTYSDYRSFDGLAPSPAKPVAVTSVHTPGGPRNLFATPNGQTHHVHSLLGDYVTTLKSLNVEVILENVCLSLCLYKNPTDRMIET